MSDSSTPNEIIDPTQEDYTKLYEAMKANIDAASELRFARVAIMQPQSPEITRQEMGYKQGMLVDSISREILSSFIKPPWLIERGIEEAELTPTHTIGILPIFKLPSEFIRWKNRNTEGMGFHWKTLDAHDPKVREGLWPPRGTWQQSREGEAPPVTENMNFLCAVLNPVDYSPMSPCIVLTFSKTSFATGKMLLSLVQQKNPMERLPYWGRLIYLHTKMETADKNTWYEYRIARGPKTADIASHCMGHCFSLAKQLAENKEFQESIINAAHLENESDGTVVDAATSDDDVFAGNDSEEASSEF